MSDHSVCVNTGGLFLDKQPCLYNVLNKCQKTNFLEIFSDLIEKAMLSHASRLSSLHTSPCRVTRLNNFSINTIKSKSNGTLIYIYFDRDMVV